MVLQIFVGTSGHVAAGTHVKPPAMAARTLSAKPSQYVELCGRNRAPGHVRGGCEEANDGTLDKRELRGRLNAKDFAASDPDGTLDKNEFLALVEKRFKAADPDNDGTIDAKELKSAAGRSLAPLLK